MEQADVYYQNLVAAFEGLAIGMRQGRPSVLPAVQKSPCGAHVDYFIDDAEHLDVVRILPSDGMPRDTCKPSATSMAR